MATAHSRHQGTYARQSTKTYPITMPAKPSKTNNALVSRVAMSPPELDDASTVYSRGGRSGGTFSDISDDFSSRGPGIDVMDELSDRMSRVFDPNKMDRLVVKQTQTSGSMNAAQRQLAEQQALLQQRSRATRVKFDRTMEKAREAQEDLRYVDERTSRMKATAVKKTPEAYEEARRSRQSRR